MAQQVEYFRLVLALYDSEKGHAKYNERKKKPNEKQSLNMVL